MKKLIPASATVLLFLFSSIHAGGPGTTTASFLKIGVGARNIGMGETGSISEDVNGVYWNPAGIASLKEKEISFMHAAWLEQINYEHLAFAMPMGAGAIGAAVNYLSMSPMATYDKDGVKIENETFTANDLAVTLSYGKSFSLSNARDMGLNIGVNLKYVSSSIEKESAAALASDIGSQIKLKNGKIKFGLAVQNIGSGMKFKNETDPLPFNIKLGSAYTLMAGPSSPLLLAIDVNIPADNDARVNLGVEFIQKFGPLRLSPRVGYKTNTRGLEGLSGLTAGMGFNINTYCLDYAFVPYGLLGDTHRVSLSVKF
ncbi:MAG: PorV/PorQ family protein [Elusimicrobiota bacterium]